MILNSAISEGLAGMQQSQKKMQQAADDIVKAGVATDSSPRNLAASAAHPVSNAGTAIDDLPADRVVGATSPGAESRGAEIKRSDDIVGPLIEQKKQELLFNASANVVETSQKALGSLIDDLS